MREAFCNEHGMFHYLGTDPTCEFVDGFGNPINPEEEV